MGILEQLWDKNEEMSPEEKEISRLKLYQRVRESRDEDYQEANKKQHQESQHEAQTYQWLKDNLKTVIAIRAIAKNISQKEVLEQIQEEMNAIKRKAKSQ